MPLSKKQITERAYRRVFGRTGHRTPDQEIVYDNLRMLADEPNGNNANGFQTNPMMLNEGSRTAIMNILRMVDKKQLDEDDEDTKPKIIKDK